MILNTFSIELKSLNKHNRPITNQNISLELNWKQCFRLKYVHKSQLLLLIHRIMKCITVNWIPEHRVLICSFWGWTAYHGICPFYHSDLILAVFHFLFQSDRGSVIDLNSYLFALKHLRYKPKVCDVSPVYQILNILVDQIASLITFIILILDFSLVGQFYLMWIQFAVE